MAIQSRGSNFVPVTCRCGRSLRARLEQVGTEIRCWDCHQAVMVPMPRARLHVARELADNFAAATRGRALGRIVAASAVVTAGLCVPSAGLAVGGLLLMLVATAHGPEIRRAAGVDDGPRPARGWATLPGTIARGCLGAALAAGVFYPIWVRHAGEGHPPHLDRPGLTIFLATWAILPIASQMANGNGLRGMLGPWRMLRLMLRFPLATAAALAIAPACFVLLEIGLASLFYVQGTFAFFTLEFMPLTEKPIVYQGIPYFQSLDFRTYPGSKFVPNYLLGLGRGFSFVGGFPPSLSIDSRAGFGSIAFYIPEEVYWVIRCFVTFMIFLVLLTASAVQARWLGAITAFEKRRPA